MTDQTPAPEPTPAPAPAPNYAAQVPGAPAGARVAPPPGVDYPGKTLGIVGLVLAILVPLVGLIISVVANNQSKAAGYPNQLAKIGIIVGAILTALYVIGFIISAIISAAAFSTIGTY